MLKIADVVEAVYGKVLQRGKARSVTEVVIDSRQVRRGGLFVAIQGQRLDGHDFISQVILRQPAALVVSRPVVAPAGITVIQVEDTTRALGWIAGLYRSRFSIPVIGITGSTGKTTTKDMLTQILGGRRKILKNYKTENNQYGVPLTLLKLRQHHQAVVVEMGTNHFGEMAWLASVAKPTIAVFTNVGPSHLEFLKSPAGVFREKLHLLKNTLPGGTVIFNRDDRYLAALQDKPLLLQKISYALDRPADYRASAVRLESPARTTFVLRGRKFSLASPARHNVANAAAALACGYLLKISAALLQRRLARFRFPAGRQHMRRVRGMLLMDDTYNANPISFASAVRTLGALRARGRKIVVCGDMRELGPQSKKLHEDVAKMICQTDTEYVVTLGEQARFIGDYLKQHSHRIAVSVCFDIQTAAAAVKKICRPGDAVLIKGSRSMGMERIVAALELSR
ncbi:MAG: UDP-N-acetylmuramoyl-tripeptide--D-alanyl-D-alanine ligase [Candidatus Omnitrophica bacterium]|nr:UDP-N-acetylmuramoyl-tripeptide--D-alanyl-D-alanine ligase [Candidatus Omnitrophota bacterium]